MQSFLGDYTGSRKDSLFKLNRAIQSFENQTNKNTELVLVSDNCDLTRVEWENNWKGNPRIKFFHLVDDSKKMYQKLEEGIFYRGYPRQIGINNSSGEIITYMDSDDYILTDYLENLSRYWESTNGIEWIFNNTWYENELILANQPNGYYDSFQKLDPSTMIKIQGLESQWIQSRVKVGKILMSPALISHRRSCDVSWEDVIRRESEGLSEDTLFNRKLRQKYKLGGLVSVPGYIRCHLAGHWDY
jgi:glycosyltransferase involved in cell wall biosynthesis